MPISYRTGDFLLSVVCTHASFKVLKTILIKSYYLDISVLIAILNVSFNTIWCSACNAAELIVFFHLANMPKTFWHVGRSGEWQELKKEDSCLLQITLS